MLAEIDFHRATSKAQNSNMGSILQEFGITPDSGNNDVHV